MRRQVRWPGMALQGPEQCQTADKGFECQRKVSQQIALARSQSCVCHAGERYAWRPELLGPNCFLFARKFPEPTAEPILEVRRAVLSLCG